MRTKLAVAGRTWPGIVAGRSRVAGAARMVRLSLALALTVATVASAQSYRVLKNFMGRDGAGPSAGLVLAGNTLYGTTTFGGNLYSGYASGNGVVFKVNTDGSGFTVLRAFNGTDGYDPWGAGLVLVDGMLYGTTGFGPTANPITNSYYGAEGYGEVFRLNTDGSGFTVLKRFTNTDGCSPCTGLVLVGSTLYGTTGSCGKYGGGEVFKMNTDGSGFAVVSSFDQSFGHPYGDLVWANGTLYGTTELGPVWGAVFKVNTDGSGFAVLKIFGGGSDGRTPQAAMVLAGSTLYGTAWVVFKVNTDGSGYQVLKNFSGSDGYAYGGVVLAGSTLYGTTANGGSSGYGVVFKVNTNGSGYQVLKNFTGRDGASPEARLVLAGNTLYGTTTGGGNSDAGVVFSLTLLTITTPPATQTAEAGTTVGFQVGATSATPGLAYQWFFDGTNALAGATDALLQLANIQPVQAGAYTVVVTNLAEGAVTSAPAMLSVIPRVDRRVVPAVHLTGGTGSFLHVEYADSLGAPQWSSVSNLTLGGGPQFCFDFCQPVPAQRFYRAWQTNGPNPALDVTMATELTLTGEVGSHVRIDWINQVGPPDAWVTLDTVTLTNTTQPYFDFTMFGQPSRLYRLVAVP